MTHNELVPKDRMLRALRGEHPDVLPAAPAYLSLFLADAERAHYIEQYRRRLAGRSRYPVDHSEDTLFRAAALRRAYEVFQAIPDWIAVHRGGSRAWAERTAIVAEQGVLMYEDQCTGERIPMHGVGLPSGEDLGPMDNERLSDLWDLSPQIRHEDDVDARLPVTAASDLLARGDFDLPMQVVRECGDEFLIYTILDTPYSDAYDLLGFQGMMLIQHDRPRLFHYLLHRQLAQSREVVRAWGSTGVDAVYVEEVFSGADMISARAYDEFVFPYNQSYFQHMRKVGPLPIHYVCGDVIPRLHRIALYDVAAIAVEESKKAFRIELQQVVGRVGAQHAVFGNIDTVRFGLNGTSEEMAAEVRRQAGIGAAAKGFVVSTGSPFSLGTNPQMIDSLVVAAHQLRG